MKRTLPFFLLLLLLLGACAQDAPVATSTPPPAGPDSTSAAAASATVPAATNTPPPTTVPATPTSIPTSTLPPEPSATATPEGVTLLTAEDFGDDRNPLTGELVSDPAVLQRRPIAVKISNAPPSYVRPQSGPGQADLVFEHIAEFDVTRFTAIIYSDIPPDMGPIRSGRLIDVELPVMYDAAFAYSGSSAGVAQKLFASEFADRILRANVQGYYRTGADKPYEHTLYGDPELWYAEVTARDEDRPPVFNTYMAFSEITPAGGEPATEISIDYGAQTVDWRYDADSGRYLRWNDGAEHMDANTGEQLSAANVVAVYAVHQLDYDICEHISAGASVCAAYSMEIQIWGEGRAVVFRDGEQFEVTWRRENREDMLTFYDAEGNKFPLQIGNSWFQMVPSNGEDIVTVTP